MNAFFYGRRLDLERSLLLSPMYYDAPSDLAVVVRVNIHPSGSYEQSGGVDLACFRLGGELSANLDDFAILDEYVTDERLPSRAVNDRTAAENCTAAAHRLTSCRLGSLLGQLASAPCFGG